MATYPSETGPAVTETTPGGVTFERVTVTTTTGDAALLTTPTSVARGSGVTLVIACHGHGGSNNTFEVHAPSKGIRDRMTDDGYVFIAPHMHGNTWGNQAALNDLKAAYDYATGLWNVNHVLLFGGSMGGLTAVQAYARDAVPNVRGVAAAAPAVNLASNYANADYQYSIRMAYGIAEGGSDYDTKTAGFDPVLHDPSQYAGGRFRFYHSPTDTAIPKADHPDLFVSNGLTAQMADFDLITMSGGHLEAGNYDAADTSMFYASALAAAPNPAPTVPGVAATVHAIKAWDGAAWVPAAAKAWDGAAWVEARPTGYVPA